MLLQDGSFNCMNVDIPVVAVFSIATELVVIVVVTPIVFPPSREEYAKEVIPEIWTTSPSL